MPVAWGKDQGTGPTPPVTSRPPITPPRTAWRRTRRARPAVQLVQAPPPEALKVDVPPPGAQGEDGLALERGEHEVGGRTKLAQLAHALGCPHAGAHREGQVSGSQQARCSPAGCWGSGVAEAAGARQRLQGQWQQSTPAAAPGAAACAAPRPACPPAAAALCTSRCRRPAPAGWQTPRALAPPGRARNEPVRA